MSKFKFLGSDTFRVIGHLNRNSPIPCCQRSALHLWVLQACQFLSVYGVNAKFKHVYISYLCERNSTEAAADTERNCFGAGNQAQKTLMSGAAAEHIDLGLVPW